MGDLRSEIESQLKGFLSALNSGDVAGVAAYYTEGARFLPPNAETMTGREAIQAAWQFNMDNGVKSAELEIVELQWERKLHARLVNINSTLSLNPV